MKRILAFVLALLMTAGVVVACNKAAEKPAGGTTTGTQP
jgi:membrane protein CcdC involved in cytochrome C biogenesis